MFIVVPYIHRAQLACADPSRPVYMRFGYTACLRARNPPELEQALGQHLTSQTLEMPLDRCRFFTFAFGSRLLTKLDFPQLLQAAASLNGAPEAPHQYIKRFVFLGLDSGHWLESIK